MIAKPRHLRMLSITIVLAACAEKTPPPGDSTPAAPPAITSSTLEPVPMIDSVRCTIVASPKQLVVEAYGQVTTGGWTNPTLSPRTYVAPPTGGIWEFDFTAVKPTGMVTQALTPISATHNWAENPTADLKGIRVYGVDAGVKEIAIAACGQS